MHIHTVTFSQDEIRDMLSRSDVHEASLTEGTTQADIEAISAHVKAIESSSWVFSGKPLVIG